MKYWLFGVLLVAMTSCSNKHAAPIDPHEYAQQIASHRADYLTGFLKDPRSPLDSADLDRLTFFDPDLDYRCLCQFTKLDQVEPFPMSTYAGTVQDYIRVGTATCPIASQRVTLELYQNVKMLRMPMYRNRYFLPFRDATNGEATYGGGRYIDLKADTIKDGALVIDFNKAYNPWCAYSDGYACPIPPAANHLDVAIKAGEAQYQGPIKSKQ